jgi:peptidoglycan L-alanyl-D-glutamate endopeptidase CwlK
MPSFGVRSNKIRDELHPDLVLVVDEVIKVYNCSLICGKRGEKEQNKAFAEGKSKVKYPNSRHNTEPKSEAVDATPYPLNWNDIEEFKRMVKQFKIAAKKVNVEIECGADWKTFKDYPHVQLKRPVRKVT